MSNQHPLVVSRGLVVCVESRRLLHEAVSILLQLLACAVLARVEPLALVVVDGLG